MTEHRPRTVLVTGATDGLGRGVAIELGKRGETVLVHGRDEQRIADTLAALHSAAPHAQVRAYRADLSSTRAGAAALSCKTRLDVAYCTISTR